MSAASTPLTARTPKAAAVVANSLRRTIVSGKLPVGSWLPPENRLVEEFDVSRPTLRAALRILESEQLITVRRGSRGGAMVNAPTNDALARRAGTYLQYQQVTLDEVHRARAVVEPPAVALLARRRDPKDIAALKAALDREIELVHDRAAFRASALEFHRIIIERCGNLTLTAFGAMLHGVIEQHADRYAVNQAKYRHGAERHREHIEVIGLIEAGDAVAAEEFWRAHLEAARQVLMREGGANTLVDLMS
ncbi:MAG TPA: FadR/GntR family transcriptional regulator [Acidimicrobiales bacterium]|nr:FadR/GntR family transcriptional regulator [Acidimicrobiales bacterium]